MTDTAIAAVSGFRVWDSRGRPTVEAEVTLSCGATGRAMAPAGASRGSGEAVDLRDGGTAYGGHDVTRALASISNGIAPDLIGMDAADQSQIDRHMADLDGSADKGRLGGNATIAVSIAVAQAAAAARGVPLWRHIAGDVPPVMPLPEVQIFGGGAHAGRFVDIQDFMIVPVGAGHYTQALNWAAEVYRAAGELMAKSGRLAGVADEGGWWPAFDSNEEALGVIVSAIERAGLTPGRDVGISLDIAASQFGGDGRYKLERDGRAMGAEGLCAMLCDWVQRYPIVSMEDPLAEDDHEGMIALTRAVGHRVQVVGDDYLVTDARRIARAAASGACNAVLIKPNQAGTLTETRQALEAARSAGYGVIVSARSGETEDVSIVHLAVGWGAPQIKVGSFARSERMAKWNEGLRIMRSEDAPSGRLPPSASFPWNANVG